MIFITFAFAMIPQQTIDRIIDTAQIVDVVSDFVALRRSGTSMIGLCPFHNEKSPSFHVSPSRNICKCFSCGEGGNPVSFVMKHESLSFPEALRWLANKYNIEVEEEEVSDEQREQRNKKESMLLVSAWAQKQFSKELLEGEEGRAIGLSYLRGRGLRDNVIEKFELGYCVDGKDKFTNQATKQGYRMEYLEATGLSIKRDNWVRDRFSGRVMFPIHSVGGRVIGFGGRTLKADEKAKYLNSPESDIYHKSRILYGIYQAKRSINKEDKCFLVEGYTDVIAMHQAGIENVVASSGTALTEDQIRLIKRFTNNVTVIYDGDAAGIKAALRGIDLILKEGLSVKVMPLPEGEDPDSFARSMSSTELEACIKANEVDFVRFKTQLLLKDVADDPIEKTKLINDIIRTIAVVPEAVTRQFYIQECSRMLKVSEEVLYDSVRKQLNNQLDDWRRTKQREDELAKRQQAHNEVTLPPEAFTEKSYAKLKANPCEIEEREILRILLRYFFDSSIKVEDEEGNEDYIMVGEYVISELESDDLISDCPTIAQMLLLFQEKLEDEEAYKVDSELVNEVLNALEESLKQKGEDAVLLNETILHFLADHSNPKISRLAADLFNNAYIAKRKWDRGSSALIKDEVESLKNAITVVILGWNLRAFFLFHPQTEINQLASDLLAEKYFESRRWSKSGAFLEREYEILNVIVPKVVFEYKLSKVRLILKGLEQKIEEAGKRDDWDTVMTLQDKYIKLKTVVKEISDQLGNRTIL